MKYIVVGMHSCGKYDVYNILSTENYKCGKLFTNNNYLDELYNGDCYETYDDEDIQQIFENNAYIFMQELDSNNANYFEGLSLYDFENNDVFILNPQQFNQIPCVELKDEVCFIWMDNNKTNRMERFKESKLLYNFNEREKLESDDLNSFISNIYNFPKSHLLYFYNEEPCRVASIIKAMIKYPDLITDFEKNFK